MKCPACAFVCSDLRDLCPSCFLDLRDSKRVLGITITDPESSYQELVSGVGGKKQPARKSPKVEPRSLFQTVRSLFGKETEAAPKSEPRKTQAVLKSAVPKRPAEKPEPKIPPLPEKKPAKVEQEQASIPEPEIKEAKAPPSEPEAEAEIEVIIPTQVLRSDSPAHEERSEAPVEPTTPIARDTFDEIEDETAKHLQELVEEEEAPEPARVIELSLTPLSLPGSEPEIEQLFQEAADERSWTPTAVDFEINAFESLQFQNREDIELLFSIAFDAFDDPEAERVFEKKATESSERVLTSDSIEEQAKLVEEAMTAPVLSLKSGGLGPVKSSESGEEEEPLSFVPIPVGRRFRAAALGFGAIFLLSLVAAAIWYQLAEPGKALLLITGRGAYELYALELAERFSLIFFPALLFHPFLLFVIGRQPLLAAEILGAQMFTLREKLVAFDHVLVHALTWPLTLLSLGLIRPHGLPLHDWLSSATLFELKDESIS